MSISIDELCDTLDVKEIPPSEAEEVPTSDNKYGNLFDGFALPTHRVISPIVSERLNGAKSVLEAGFGTGFRLLYYALNNPNTEFVALDNNPDLFESLEDRMRRLGVNNVTLHQYDIFELKIADWRHQCVLAIDCMPNEVPSRLYDVGIRTRTDLMKTAFVFFGQMVKKMERPSFFASVDYAGWSQKKRRVYSKLGERIGISRIRAESFSYQKQGEDRKSGTLFFATP